MLSRQSLEVKIYNERNQIINQFEITGDKIWIYAKHPEINYYFSFCSTVI
jgi:hypothetical protein